MIRRIAKNNDLKDLIKSCPSGVIDDITEIRYFISGHPETEIVATFEKVGSHLEAILPTSELSTLGNGVLMRRALYKVSDPAYPDGYYNLEFVDNLDVWLGEEETEDPFDPGYLTEGDLKTINGESLVGVGNIDVVNYIPDYYATKSWVSGQEYMNMEEMVNYLTAHAYATEDWVRGQDYISSIPSEYVTQSWLSSHSYMTEDDVRWILAGEGEDNPVMREEDLSYYATMNWVLDQGYITSETLPEDIATQSWVESYVSECGFAAAADVDALSRWVVSQNYATQSWVSSQNFLTSTSLTGYATESWVSSQGYLTSVPSEYATQSWVRGQNYYIEATDDPVVTDSKLWYVIGGEGEDNPFVRENTMLFAISASLTGYATQSWVSSQQFATQSWVQSQGYITSAGLSGLATQSWVLDQGYITSETLPEDIATQSWVESYVYECDFAGAADVVTLSSWIVSQNYATQSWVSSNFLSTTALTGYATESWVEAQGYLTSHQDLSSYATKSWATSEFFEESKIWTGTQSQWEQLTSAQQALYTIALVTE